MFVVGQSGAGKSTLVSLLLRLHDPTAGSILIDGLDLKRVTQASLRAQIGVVLQESFLLDTSIRDNIRMGKLDATDEEIEWAARSAEIHDFVVALPEGYQTRVGERGRNLSVGQRQRVAIARALIRQPAILILDEPASALDPQTEAAINATLRRLSRGRTVLSITHRLASAAHADRILVLKDGHLVEQGTHERLLEMGNVYSRLWQGPPAFVDSGNAPVANSYIARSLWSSGSVEYTEGSRYPTGKRVVSTTDNSVARAHPRGSGGTGRRTSLRGWR